MLERQIEQMVCAKALSLYGVESLKMNSITTTGLPDRMFLIQGGSPLFIEFKAQGKKPTLKQQYIINKLLKLGYKVEVHDNIESAIKAIGRAVESARVSEKSSQVPAGQ
jgi:hypothetical protein